MRNLFKTYFILSLAFWMQGCSEDDLQNVDSEPEILQIDQNVSSLPGLNFTLNATVEDPAGIESVNIKYEPWFLDKLIRKDSLPHSYNLNYSFKVPEDAQENSQHNISVTFVNSGGNSTTQEITVTLDLDVTVPDIVITSPANNTTALLGDGNEIDFDITVTDRELAEFKIENEYLNESFPISGDSYTYTKSLDLENTGSYTFKITVTDATGNVGVEEVVVNVLNELRFENMYISEVTDPETLTNDLFGVPFKTKTSTEEGEEGFVFTANYYAEEPNTGVRFLPQKTGFSPYTFGAEANNPGTLVIGSGAEVNPIVLEEVGYHEITIDLRDLTYTVTPYTPTDTPFDFVQLIATGARVNGESTCISNIDGSFRCFHFQSGKDLTQDPNNPYRFSAVVELFDEPDSAGNNGFIMNASRTAWAPFWRFDDGSDPDVPVFGGGANYLFTEEAYGTYNFIFDTHLQQVKITPINP